MRALRRRLNALAASDRRRLYGWLIVTLPLIVMGIGVQNRLHSTAVEIPGTEGARATALAKKEFGQSEQLLILLEGPPKRLRAEAARVSRVISARKDFSVLDPWSAGSRTLLPKPGQAILLVSVRKPFEAVTYETPHVRALLKRTVREPFTARLTGFAALVEALHEETISAVEKAELIAAIPLMIVLILVLASPIAAAIPLFLGGSVALAGWGTLDILNRFTPLDVSALSLTTAMGLALGVDYSLLMATRFQAELAAGKPVNEASEFASARTGQTIRFAALVLAATMVCALLLIPAAPLKSAVAGVLVAVGLGFVGATIVLPPLLRLVGHDINRYQLLPAASQSGRWRALGVWVLRRPVVSILAVLALLLPLCLPVLDFPSGPPDPSQLPTSSPVRHDFEAVQSAIGGTRATPFVVTVAAHKGTLADHRLLDLARFERSLSKDSQTLAVLGPAAVARRTAELASVSSRLRKASAAIRRGKGPAGRLARGLARASGGVDKLVGGLSLAAQGSERLHRGSRDAVVGTKQVDDGVAAAAQGSDQLRDGLATAADGARALHRGSGQASAGAEKIERNLRVAQRKTKAALPGATELANGLEQGQRELRLLKEPADLANEETAKALTALNKMLVTSKADPAYEDAYRAVATARGAISGRNPQTGEPVQPGYSGLPSSLDQAADRVGAAAEGARRLQRGVAELEDGLGKLSAGASQLGSGVDRLEAGAGSLAGGEDQLLTGAEQLRGGLKRLSAGTGRLLYGTEQLADGNGRLAEALGAAVGDTSPLVSGVGRLHDGARTFEKQTSKLAKGLGDTRRLAPLFKSGYTTLAALEKAPARQREAASWAINLDNGGSAVQFLVVQRDENGGSGKALPTKADNPYRGHLQGLAHKLGDRLHATALVGGPASTLSEFDLEVSSRLPVLIIALVLVSYIGLSLLMRNWLLPAIAVSLNVLSVAAAFGFLALMFGGDAPLLGGPGYVDDIMAAVIFTVVFALSIDYEIFLLDRMRESYAMSGNVKEAILDALESTASVITGAGAIMIAVFLAFAVSPMPTLRQLGLGLAIAVALDATLIRLVLLPAALQLAGDRAWRRQGSAGRDFASR